MRCKYNTKNGDILHIFVWDDQFQGNNMRGVTEYTVNDSMKQHTAPTFVDDNKDIYFVYDSERIYFKDYIFETVDKIVEKIKNGENVYEEDMIATFMKDTENVGVILSMNRFTSVVPFIGIALKVDGNEEMVLCKPVERQYKKQQWHYKIDFAPADDNMVDIFGYETYYSSDLHSMIMQGIFTLVNRNTYCLKGMER